MNNFQLTGNVSLELQRLVVLDIGPRRTITQTRRHVTSKSAIVSWRHSLITTLPTVLDKNPLTRALQQTLPTILTTTFWVPMVSGQSLVLYSRLYLINLDKRIRRYVLAMIIVNGVALHTATAVTAAGSNSEVSYLFIKPYAIIERIQITVFSLQEFILSGLYVWKAWSFLAVYRSGGSKTQDKLRAMMLHLILSNVVVVSLDITVIVLEFLGLYYLQVSSPGISCNVMVQGLRHVRWPRTWRLSWTRSLALQRVPPLATLTANHGLPTRSHTRPLSTASS